MDILEKMDENRKAILGRILHDFHYAYERDGVNLVALAERDISTVIHFDAELYAAMKKLVEGSVELCTLLNERNASLGFGFDDIK